MSLTAVPRVPGCTTRGRGDRPGAGSEEAGRCRPEGMCQLPARVVVGSKEGARC